MPKQSPFLISIFAPVASDATDHQDYPFLTVPCAAHLYYAAFETASTFLLTSLSRGVIAKVGITEVSNNQPRYILFYCSKDDNKLTLFTRKTDASPLQRLAPDDYADYFKRSNARTFAKPVKPAKKAGSLQHTQRAQSFKQRLTKKLTRQG